MPSTVITREAVVSSIIGTEGFGTSDTVKGLYFGDALQASGTWGATGSGATNINDTYFSGTGMLNVVAVPEPSTMALLVMGLLGLMGYWRKRK